jgi:hypothetical protein
MSSARVEYQTVSVQITNAELAPAVERVIQVLFKLDAFMITGLTSKPSLRGFELSRLKELVEVIDLAGIKP